MRKEVVLVVSVLFLVLFIEAVSAYENIFAIIDINKYTSHIDRITNINTVEELENGKKLSVETSILLFDEDIPRVFQITLEHDNDHYYSYSTYYGRSIVYQSPNYSETEFNVVLHSGDPDNPSTFIGQMIYLFDVLNNQTYMHIDGIIIDDNSAKVFNLTRGLNDLIYNVTLDESNINSLYDWRQSIDTWKTSIAYTINNLLLSITGLVTKTDDHDDRIELLENNSTPIKNGTLPNYFKYLSSSDRKNIVCGYAEDNRLEHIEDLGWSCDLRYRTSRGGRESVSCRCKRP